MPLGNLKGSSALFLIVLACLLPSAAAQEQQAPALGKIKRADSVAIDCSACPRSLAEAGKVAKQELLVWNRFRIVEDPKKADLIFMFSANPYLGDYLTRDGPDKRPVRIDGTIMTVVDPHTGEELWSDSMHWGSWRVGSATRALINELRGEMQVESKKWTVDEIFSCSGTPAYQAFASLTPEAALTIPELGVSRIADMPDRLRVGSAGAPEFCRRVQLVIAPDNRISGFEVVASESDTLDVADILELADRFDFTSGKDPQAQKVYFTARSKDKKILIQFDVQGRRTVLSRVSYFY